MGLYETYGFNEELGTQGKWFKLAGDEKAEFKIRYSGSSKGVKENFVRHTVEMIKIQEKIKETGQDKELVKLLDSGLKLIVENVLLDWKNVKWSFKKNEEPKNVIFSKKNAYRILKQADGMLAQISEIASSRENFLDDDTNLKKKSFSQSKDSSTTETQKQSSKNSKKTTKKSQKL